MCAVPVTCWIVCTVIQQEIKKDLALIRCKTMTSIYLLYLEVLLTHHSKKDQPVNGRPRAINTCLKKLCALAHEGVLTQQILFKEEDLQRHGLSLCEVESVFLNENIFHWEVRTQTCYSFIHLSVQEFLAALYYGLDDGSGNEEGRRNPFHLKISEGESLEKSFTEHPHLALAVQFLFGLLNEKMVKTFSEVTGINISLPARSVIKEWAMKVMNGIINTDVIVCLYETQDEDFIRRVMSQRSELEVSGSDSWMYVRNYTKWLDYCLKTLKSEKFEYLYFESLTLDPECQKLLSQFAHRSPIVRFVDCRFQGRYGDDEESSSSGHDEGSSSSGHGEGSSSSGHGEGSSSSGHDEGSSSSGHGEGSSSSGHGEGSSSSGHEMVPDILSFLRNPESKIQELDFSGCGLSSSSCDVLRSILITNPSLIRLYVSYNNVQDSGIKLLCEGLRHPNCTLQELRVILCGVTFSCCDDLCSVITTNRTLTRLDITLDDDGKMSRSEVSRRCEVLQHAGFSVDRRNGHWDVSIDRRRL